MLPIHGGDAPGWPCPLGFGLYPSQNMSSSPAGSCLVPQTQTGATASYARLQLPLTAPAELGVGARPGVVDTPLAVGWGSSGDPSRLGSGGLSPSPSSIWVISLLAGLRLHL